MSIKIGNAFIGIFSAFAMQFNAYSAEQNANKYVEIIERYETQASTLTSHELYQEIERVKQIQRLKLNQRQSIFESLADEDVLKATAFTSILEKRRQNQEPAAAFYFALTQIPICSRLLENSETTNAGNRICGEAITSLKIAAKANDPRAMHAIGLMYKEGIGIQHSKYVAADWFIKSATQYDREGLRDNSLATVEEVLNLVPDHPKALNLKNKLLR